MLFRSRPGCWPHPPELRLGGAEDAVVVLHVRAAVAGVLHVQRVVQEVQVFLDLGDVLCGVLLRVQDLREARGVRLRDRREETARPPGTLPPAGPRGPWASRRGLRSRGRLAQLSSPAWEACTASTAFRASGSAPTTQAVPRHHQDPGARGHPPRAPQPRQCPRPVHWAFPGGRTPSSHSACSLPSAQQHASVCVCARACPRTRPRRRTHSWLLLASGSSQWVTACSQDLWLQGSSRNAIGLCGRVSSSRGHTGHCCVPGKGV